MVIRTLEHAESLPPSLVESTVLLWGPVLNALSLNMPSEFELAEELDYLASYLRLLIVETQVRSNAHMYESGKLIIHRHLTYESLQRAVYIIYRACGL